MRIGGTVPYQATAAPQNAQTAVPVRRPEEVPAAGGFAAPGVAVEISPQGRAAYGRSLAQGLEGCETCKNRKYQDGSDDPSVSFQSPAHIAPGQSAAAVAAHEYEHVSHEQARAEREGRRIISQTVNLQTASCPECGRVYVSGGVTRTISVKA